MKEDNKTWIILGVIAVIAVVVGIVISNRNRVTGKQYNGKVANTMWGAIGANAADALDAGGRGLTSFNTSFMNGIIGIIATSKGGGKATFVQASYADPGANDTTKINYGPYIVGAVGFIALAVVAYSIFKN